jgi:hypothetical protein
MSGMRGIKQSLRGTIALAATAAAVVVLCGAQTASATPQTLASVTVRSPIGAYGGWVVWSTPVSGGWGLDAYHEGTVKALHVAPRAQPFDVDLGTNAFFTRSSPRYQEEKIQPVVRQHHARSSACRHQSSNSKNGSHSHPSRRTSSRKLSIQGDRIHELLADLQAGAKLITTRHSVDQPIERRSEVEVSEREHLL